MVEWLIYGSIIFLGGIVYTVWTEQTSLDNNMATLIGELRRRLQEIENQVDLLEQRQEDFRETVEEMLGESNE